MPEERNNTAPAGEAAEKPPRANPFTADDVAAILRKRGWLAEATPEIEAWLAEAAALLGPQAAEIAAETGGDARAALEGLLGLIFHYDAREVLRPIEAHTVLARKGARAVIRALAGELLDGPPVDSDRLKQIVAAVRERLGVSTRELFHPLRLVLAGRAGEGELDRVVLLLDGAAALPFAVAVKGARARMLEFISALD